MLPFRASFEPFEHLLALLVCVVFNLIIRLKKNLVFAFSTRVEVYFQVA